MSLHRDRNQPFNISIKRESKQTKANPNLDENGITTEELKLLHGCRVKRDDGVIIVDSLIDDETVRRLLPLENSSTEIFLRFPVTTTKKIKIQL